MKLNIAPTKKNLSKYTWFLDNDININNVVYQYSYKSVNKTIENININTLNEQIQTIDDKTQLLSNVSLETITSSNTKTSYSDTVLHNLQNKIPFLIVQYSNIINGNIPANISKKFSDIILTTYNEQNDMSLSFNKMLSNVDTPFNVFENIFNMLSNENKEYLKEIMELKVQEVTEQEKQTNGSDVIKKSKFKLILNKKHIVTENGKEITYYENHKLQYFYYLMFNLAGIDISKNTIFSKNDFLLRYNGWLKNGHSNLEQEIEIFIENETELLLIQNILNKYMSFDLSSLNQEIKQNLNVKNEVNADDNNKQMYFGEVSSFLNKNNGNGIIADSITIKENAVLNWLNTTNISNKKVLIIGKDPSCKKYEDEISKNNIKMNIDIYKNTLFTKEETLKKILNEQYDYIIINDAEILRDKKGLMSKQLEKLLEQQPIQNKIFVSSNPIFNNLSEIENMIKFIYPTFAEDITKTFKKFSSRKLSNFKDTFLLQLLKKFILKREKQHLTQMSSNEVVKTIKYQLIDQNTDITLNEQKIYEELTNTLENFISDAFYNILDNNKEYIVSLNNITPKTLFENFESFKNNFLIYQDKNNILPGIQKELYNVLYGKFNIKNRQDITYEKIEEIKNAITNNKDIFDNTKNGITKKEQILGILKRNNFSYLIDEIMNLMLKKQSLNVIEFDNETNELIGGSFISSRLIKNIDETLTSFKIGQDDINIKEQLIDEILSKITYKSQKSKVILDISNIIDVYIRFYDILIEKKNRYINSSLGSITPKDAQKYLKIDHNLDIFDYGDYQKLKPILEKQKKVLEKLKSTLEDDIKETIDYQKVMSKVFNFRSYHQKVANLKTNTTLNLVDKLGKQENILILTQYKNIISTLEKTLKKNYKVFILNGTTEQKQEILLNVSKETNPCIVLSTYTQFNENLQNEYKSKLLLNDLPWNYATLEKVTNTVPTKEVEILYNKVENDIEKMFIQRLLKKETQTSQIYNDGGKSDLMQKQENSVNVDDNVLKKEWINNVITNFFITLTEQKFNNFKTNVIDKQEMLQRIINYKQTENELLI